MEKIYYKASQLKLVFIINTEGQAHTWKNIAKEFVHNQNNVSIFARDYGKTLKLLDQEGFMYKSFKPIKNRLFKALDIFKHSILGLNLRLTSETKLIIGFGVDANVVAKMAGVPSIIFTDSEPNGIQNILIKWFSDCIITPAKFGLNLGKKHLRIPSYKELAYLHPNHFTPDPSIKKELALNDTDKYAILRFNGFDAVHDIGRTGFSLRDKYALVENLKPYLKVLISSEVELPGDLQQYAINISYQRIHHALYYADLLIADTGTMATEASVLGTPTIMCLSNYKEFGNFVELENDYDLMYAFSNSNLAIKKALELVQEPDLKTKWRNKRSKLLEDKIDLTSFTVDLISRWPESFNELKASKVDK
jgi:predicted glycosyltransferase